MVIAFHVDCEGDVKTFRVVLEGIALPGFAPDEVRQRLALLIDRSEEVAARLLRGHASTVKKGVDEATSSRYVEALTKIGVACHAEPENLELDVDEHQVAPPTATPKARGPDESPPVTTSRMGMSSYVDSVIGKDETVLYQAHLSLASYWVWFFLGGLLLIGGLLGSSLGLVVVAAALLLRPILAKLTTELVITNRRVIAKFGLIRRSTIELNLSKIESIRVEQGLWGRMFDYGDIMVVGTGGSKEPIPRIEDPLEFRRMYDEILARNQSKTS